jgi:hypothetical protein
MQTGWTVLRYGLGVVPIDGGRRIRRLRTGPARAGSAGNVRSFAAVMALRPTVRLGRTGGLRVRACRRAGATPPLAAVGFPRTLSPPAPRMSAEPAGAPVSPAASARALRRASRAKRAPCRRTPPGKSLALRLWLSGLSRGGRG